MSPRYAQLDVIREKTGPNTPGARRWQVVAVEPDTYLIHLLYAGYREPDYSRWKHTAADAFTELEWSPGSPKRIGATCAKGHSRLPGVPCDCKPDVQPNQI